MSDGIRLETCEPSNVQSVQDVEAAKASAVANVRMAAAFRRWYYRTQAGLPESEERPLLVKRQRNRYADQRKRSRRRMAIASRRVNRSR